ncbi:MAG: ATP-binding cassette domain-containing protein [Methanomicrobiales archaeon]|nr:ATP-binding cassette domain-containing protein [Methanomicrobiales archaeon]
MAPVIRVEGLTKAFGNTIAVDHISFEVERGEFFGFLGPNGAGKTTTVRILTGVIPMDSGHASVLGHRIDHDPVQVKQQIGVVPETSNAYVDLTAWENLQLMGELYGLDRSRAEKRSGDLLHAFGLYDKREEKVQAYSKGMKQRLLLAMALLHEPPVLFLDEPTSGLDVQSVQMIQHMLRELNEAGTTIFLTTHNMEEANRLCRRVGIVRSGRLVAIDAPERLKSTVERVHTIEVSFSPPVDEEFMKGLEGISSATRMGDKWRITAEDQDMAIRSLVMEGGGRGHSIVTLNTLAPSLDDVFLRLTEGEMG